MGLLHLAARGALLGLFIAVCPSASTTDEDCPAVDEDEVIEPQRGRALLQARVAHQPLGEENTLLLDKHAKGGENFSLVDKHAKGGENYSLVDKHAKGAENYSLVSKHAKGGENFSLVSKHAKGAENYSLLDKHAKGGENYSLLAKHAKGGENFSLLADGLSEQELSETMGCIVTCGNYLAENREKACSDCMAKSVSNQRKEEVGLNGLKSGYIQDVRSLLAGGSKHAYAAQFCSRGHVAGCAKKDNFPGDGSTSIMGWDRVAEMMRHTPQKEWSGEWWRGNELGIFINNPVFWSSSDINPMSSVTGILPSQHAAIRPILEEMFTLHCDDRRLEVGAIVTSEIQTFLAHRLKHGLRVPDDIKALVHQILYRVTFNKHIQFDDAEKFVTLQSEVFGLGAVSQVLPASLYQQMLDVRKKMQGYLQEYAELIKKRWGQKLAKEDCSPSASCLDQAASAVFDTFYSVGGMTVPTTISTGVSILLSKDGSNPFPQASFSREKALEFYWENIRYFPPIDVFAHWEKRPTCAGTNEAATAKLNGRRGTTKACPLGARDKDAKFPKVNQYQGGKRVLPNIALAQADPKKWGPDAWKFVIRPLAEYGKSLGFAEMAADSSVAGGKMNRACPGKDLALVIGTTFFELFNQGDWASSYQEIKFTNGPGWLQNHYTLSSHQMVEDCNEICPDCSGPWPSCWTAQGKCGTEKRWCATKRKANDWWR